MTHIVWWGWPPANTNMEVYGTTMYKEFFPEGPDFTYHYDPRTVPAGQGAVLVINSCISEQTATAFGVLPPIRYDIAREYQLSTITDIIKRMPWVVILLAQDEDAHTPLDTLVHPNMRIWVQVPKPRPTLSHPGLGHMYKCGLDVRPLPVGWDGMFDCLSSYKPSFGNRPIDWLFKGQSVYHRHGEWLTALQNLANHPHSLGINEHGDQTPNWTFIKYAGQDATCWDSGTLPTEDFIKLHTSAKIIICRPENWNPCPARVFFVLQAGCIPIVPERPSLRDSAWNKYCDWNGWWDYMLGEKPPFPVVKDASDLPYVLEQTLNEWPENGKRIHTWWTDYKKRLGASLRAEIESLQR